ncbi:hypothetical protein U8C35_07750 [Sinorhizobium medicae]|uniref:hypothetical protein n=1 Tax=Sinorhizobium medicae TaxID=110321 RepID=UPI002AF6AFC2|nr:hypothetical protein [Sinorhizobium medicae]WQO60305.1 hypothetical protein U8C35_07750 [Sinorhizobium medicae]
MRPPSIQRALKAWREFMSQPPAARVITLTGEGRIAADTYRPQQDYALYLSTQGKP